MPHLEGVLTLVSGSGPWFRVQGRHIRPANSKRFSVRLVLDPESGPMLDVHLGESVWVRAGWYPAHVFCRPTQSDYPAPQCVHRCWARHLPMRVFETGSKA